LIEECSYFLHAPQVDVREPKDVIGGKRAWAEHAKGSAVLVHPPLALEGDLERTITCLERDIRAPI
jgi:hypothetical protein